MNVRFPRLLPLRALRWKSAMLLWAAAFLGALLSMANFVGPSPLYFVLHILALAVAAAALAGLAVSYPRPDMAWRAAPRGVHLAWLGGLALLLASCVAFGIAGSRDESLAGRSWDAPFATVGVLAFMLGHVALLNVWMYLMLSPLERDAP